MLDPDFRSLLESRFPNLKVCGYEITSEPTWRYNCIAWAAEDDKFWWEPISQQGCYWPPEAPKTYDLESYIQAYRSLGYEECDDDLYESGYQKIAIFVNHGIASHAARQLETGAWTSKLGPSFDIQHDALFGIEGTEYGFVAQVMKRTVRSQETA